MSDSEINWQEKWDQGQIGFHQENFNSDLVTYMDRVISESDELVNVFVPLCGKTRDMLWLSEKFIKVFGVELSHLAMEQFEAENNRNFKKSSIDSFTTYSDDKYTLYQGDFFKLDKSHLPHVTHIYDRASMIALPKKIRKSYSKHLTEVIKAPHIFLITIDYDQDKVHGPPYSVPQDEVRSYYGQSYLIEVMSEVVISEGVPPRFAEEGATIKKTVYFMKRKK